MLLAGCANHTRPVVFSEPPTMSQRNFEALWQAAQDVLREHYFSIERMDRREGLMITEPLTGQQAWEVWRRDAATWYALAEGTLQTIYRQATVRIVPVEGEPNAYQARVEVNAYRSNRPKTELDSISGSYSMFLLPGGNSAVNAPAILGYERTLYGLPGYAIPPGEPVGQTVSLGPDPALAAKLAGQINRRAVQVRVSGLIRSGN